MKWNGFVGPEKLLKLGFVARHCHRTVNLKYWQWKYPEEHRKGKSYRMPLISLNYLPRVFSLQWCVVSCNHFEEFPHQPGIWIELNIAGEYEMCHRRVACNVPAHVHGIKQFLLRLVQLRWAHVEEWRVEAAIEGWKKHLIVLRNLRKRRGLALIDMRLNYTSWLTTFGTCLLLK